MLPTPGTITGPAPWTTPIVPPKITTQYHDLSVNCACYRVVASYPHSNNLMHNVDVGDLLLLTTTPEAVTLMHTASWALHQPWSLSTHPTSEQDLAPGSLIQKVSATYVGAHYATMPVHRMGACELAIMREWRCNARTTRRRPQNVEGLNSWSSATAWCLDQIDGNDPEPVVLEAVLAEDTTTTTATE